MTTIRIRITSPSDHNRTYVTRYNGRVSYMNAVETPLALSNLISSDAAEVRFMLEDAKTGVDAVRILKTTLARQWRNHRDMPKVELL